MRLDDLPWRILTARLAPAQRHPRLDAQVLLAHILQKPRAWVLAHPEAELSLAQQQDSAAQRGSPWSMASRCPISWVIGSFTGWIFMVTPAVLIPRPETELLVEHALDWLRAIPACRWAADIGTGSGCIAIALASHIPDLQVLATDLSPQALEIARRNAAHHGVAERITFLQADLLALPADLPPFDLICRQPALHPQPSLAELPVSQWEPLWPWMAARMDWI